MADPGAPIQLTRHDDEDSTRLDVAGELDLAAGQTLREAVDDVLDAGAETVVLDLAQVEFLDSAGLAAVLQSARDAHGRGRRFRVRSPSGSEARLVIELSGVGGMLGIDEGPS